MSLVLHAGQFDRFVHDHLLSESFDEWDAIKKIDVYKVYAAVEQDKQALLLQMKALGGITEVSRLVCQKL